MQIDKTTCLNGALWRSDNLAGADAETGKGFSGTNRPAKIAEPVSCVQ